MGWCFSLSASVFLGEGGRDAASAAGGSAPTTTGADGQHAGKDGTYIEHILSVLLGYRRLIS